MVENLHRTPLVCGAAWTTLPGALIGPARSAKIDTAPAPEAQPEPVDLPVTASFGTVRAKQAASAAAGRSYVRSITMDEALAVMRERLGTLSGVTFRDATELAS